MSTTPNLALPFILAGQAQKHITHNEALEVLDALVQLAVVNRTTTSPPASPVNGARYIIAATATGAWLGRETQIASFEGGAWVYYLPAEGWAAWDRAADTFLIFCNGVWTALFSGDFSDTVFTLRDDADSTRQARFQLSSISPATMRTFTLPNLDATLAHLGNAAQSFLGTVAFLNGTTSLTNGTSNFLVWGTAGIGAPALTTRSPGTKLVLYPLIGASSTDYAMGVESGALWASIPFATPSTAFKWYAATTLVATLQGDGAFVTSRLGLGGAVPDASNRLSVNAPAVLLNHAGASMQATLNKAAAGNDAGFIFQTGFSTRALFGLLGTDDFRLSVSPDGAAFFDAFTVARATGRTTIANGLVLSPAAADPASPVDGLAWYNSTAGRFRARQSSASIDLAFPAGVFGDGSDGDVTIGSGVTTLDRDMSYNNLTINGTGQLNTANFKVFVRGTLDLSAAPAGAIVANGGAGGAGTSAGPGGTAGTRISTGSTLLAGSTNAGGNGGAAAGAAGGSTGTATGSIIGGHPIAGAGGAGSGGAGGAAGTAAPPSAVAPSLRRLVLDFVNNAAGALAAYGMGRNAAGGGGGGDGTIAGAGGGGAGGQGGCVAIWANVVQRGTNTTAAIIQATGGAGGVGGSATGGNRGGGGGGTGGAGGLVYIAFGSRLGSAIANAIDVTGGGGGAGGNGFGTGIGGGGGGRGGQGRVNLVDVINGSGSELLPNNGGAGTATATIAGGAGAAAVLSRINL